MSAPYIGEIKIFGGNFAPAGWALCSGQLLPISENDALFNLIGTTFGGDGEATLDCPISRGRVPIHQGTYSGNTYTPAQNGGTESVTLTTLQIPVHSHPPQCNSANGTSTDPTNNFWAAQPALLPYTADGTANSNMNGFAGQWRW